MKLFSDFRLSIGETIVLLLIAIISTFLICGSCDIRPSSRDVAVTDSIARVDTVYVPKGMYVLEVPKYRDRPQRTTTSTTGNKDAISPTVTRITPIVDTLLQGDIITEISKVGYKIKKQTIRYRFRKACTDSTDVDDIPKKPPSTMLATDTIKNQSIKDSYNDIKCDSGEPSVQDRRPI